MRVSARFTPLRLSVHGILLAIATLLVLDAPSALAATYYVDAANTKATDLGTGAGASATPYKTIQAAVTARAIGGNTIIVKPSIYRESVSVTVSGISKKSIVIKTSGPGVVVSGSDDFAATAKWTLVAGNVYLASSVTWQPVQVFANGARLDTVSVTPASLPANTFRYVSGTGLYVNAGGGNPGLKNLEVGRRGVGIDLVASYVTIDGFEVTRTEDRGIYVHGAVSTSIVQNCKVSFARSYGLHVDMATAMIVLKNFSRDNGDHGISITGSPACKVQNNECWRNARPTSRAANGINVHSSPIACGLFMHRDCSWRVPRVTRAKAYLVASAHMRYAAPSSWDCHGRKPLAPLSEIDSCPFVPETPFSLKRMTGSRQRSVSTWAGCSAVWAS